VSRIFLVFAVALVALMAGALFYTARVSTPEPPAAAQEIQRATAALHPDFTLPDVTGTNHDFSEWQGKNRMLNFWATWCAPCRREIPLLKTFQDTHGDEGFQVIGIAVDFAEAVSHYAEEAEFNYPILVGEEDAMAIAESVGVQIPGLPLTMFVASDGEFLSAYIGELHQSQLDTIVAVMTQLDRREIAADEARSALDRL